MPNKKILGIIKQGSHVWNEWRKNNPDDKPDLSDAILCSESLSGINFNEINLSRVNLLMHLQEKAVLPIWPVNCLKAWLEWILFECRIKK